MSTSYGTQDFKVILTLLSLRPSSCISLKSNKVKFFYVFGISVPLTIRIDVIVQAPIFSCRQFFSLYQFPLLSVSVYLVCIFTIHKLIPGLREEGLPLIY